jgi:NitT/TauT family transport system substrate-binding protein
MAQQISRRLARTSMLAFVAVALAGAFASTGQAIPSAQAWAIGQTASRAAQTQRTVRVGVAGLVTQAGFYLAQSQGYFAEEGLAVEFVPVEPSTVFPTLIAGQIDVAGLGMEVGMYNAMLRGVEFRIVAQVGSEGSANGVFFVVRKDLIDSGQFRTEADLRGLKIAVPSRGTTFGYIATRALAAGGLTLDDAELVELNFAAMVTALGSHAVDVALLPEPLATVAVQNGSGVKWKGLSEVVPDFQQGVTVFSPQFAAQHDLATRWTTAYLRGIREYNDAFRKNLHRPETVETLAAVLGIKPALFDGMGFAELNPDGKLKLETIQNVMQWYLQMGYLSESVDINRVVDASFMEAAVDKLGAYQ